MSLKDLMRAIDAQYEPPPEPEMEPLAKAVSQRKPGETATVVKTRPQPMTGASVKLTFNGKPIGGLDPNSFYGIHHSPASVAIQGGAPLTQQTIAEAALLMIHGQRDWTKPSSYFDLTEEEIEVVVKAGWAPADVNTWMIVKDIRASGKWQHDKVPPPATEPPAPPRSKFPKRGPRFKTENDPQE